MILKEITFDEIILDAISIVQTPATKEAFLQFAKEEKPNVSNTKLAALVKTLLKPTVQDQKYFKYRELDVKEFNIDGKNTRPFCKIHNDKIYSEREVKNWINLDKDVKKENGYKEGYADNFLMNFPNYGYKMDNVFYNCQHVLEEIPSTQLSYGQKYYINNLRMSAEDEITYNTKTLNFYDDVKKTIIGIVMVPNQLIYRSTALGQEGYVYFKAETIKKLMDNFNNKYFTIEHKSLLNSVKLVKSRAIETIEESQKYKTKIGAWLMEIDVQNDDEYKKMKELGESAGFSIEAYLKQ